MSDFNRLTLTAAVEVLGKFKAHSDFELLQVQWGLEGRCRDSSLTLRLADLAAIAITEIPEVLTKNGLLSLGRVLVEMAINAPSNYRNTEPWKTLIAGLRFDGYEVMEVSSPGADEDFAGEAAEMQRMSLVRMLPDDVPGTDFREAESEVMQLLQRFDFATAVGHLEHSLSAFQRGEWSSANGELRNFFECCLNNIADALDYAGDDDSKMKRNFLGSGAEPPFLLADYNEWESKEQKQNFVLGLVSRLNPHGGHPGLSEEDDAAFRLQVVLITARLFLRRLAKRFGQS